MEIAHRNVPQVNCMAWSSHAAYKDLMVYGTPSGSVTVVNWDKGTEDLVNTPLKYGTRPCTSVSWNQQAGGLIAASFDKVRSEYCAMVWDIEHQQQGGAGAVRTLGLGAASATSTTASAAASAGLQPVFRASYQEAASCVTWMPSHRHLLVVGTAFGYIRIFDVNGSKKSDVGSVMAYKKGTSSKGHGITIRSSPFSDNIVASFTDTPGDPVKIWDLRKLDTSFRLTQTVAVVDASSDLSANKVVTEVQWSPVRRGVLAVAAGDSSKVEFYDVSRGREADELNRDLGDDGVGELAVVSSPLFDMDVGTTVRDISWCRGQHQLQTSSEAGGDIDPRPRLLLATDARSFDLPVVETVAVAVGRDEVVYSGRELRAIPLHPRSPFGRSLAPPSSDTSLSPAGIGGVAQDGVRDQPQPLDMDVLMRLRAQAGYGLDGARNARVLSRELDDIPYSAHAVTGLTLQQERTSGLLHVWDWLARVEALKEEKPDVVACVGGEAAVTSLRANAEASATSTEPERSVFSVETCGVLKLVGMRASVSKARPSLATSTFESKRRNLARALCGWCETLDAGGVTDGSGGESDGDGVREGDVSGDESESSRSGKSLENDNSSSNNSSDSTDESEGEGDDSDSSDGMSSDDGVGVGGGGAKDGKSKAKARSGKKSRRDKMKMSATMDNNDDDNDHGGDCAERAQKMGGGLGLGAWKRAGDLGPLVEIVEESEIIDSFERAAALALFHGNPGLAVRVLQRNVIERRRSLGVSPKARAGSNGGEQRRGCAWGAASMADSNGERIVAGGESEQLAWHEQVSEDYLQVVSLVAMGVAGFMNFANQGLGHGQRGVRGRSRRRVPAAGDGGGGGGAETEMWQSMSREVLRQLKHFTRPASCYLSAMCSFLLCNLGSGGGGGVNKKSSKVMLSTDMARQAAYHTHILENRRLTLEDRVAFACTYLSDGEATHYLKTLQRTCLESGNVEGLLVTGLGDDGLDLLGRYLDRFDDLQTTALLAARLDVSKSSSGQSDIGSNRPWVWLYEYRRLLNRWQLFVQRAALDVALGHRFRTGPSGTGVAGVIEDKGSSGGGAAKTEAVTGKASGSGGSALGAFGRGGSARRAADGSDRRSAADRTLWTLPPQSPGAHVFLRCHYCQSSLPVDCMDKANQSAWLRRQRPIISCCPNCKKPLPRCYVCLLYMGLVNPQLEYNRIARQRQLLTAKPKPGAQQVAAVEDTNKDRDKEDRHNVLDFGKWFTWCQHCRHGGHAACLNDWFADHGSCGVNGCDCACKNIR